MGSRFLTKREAAQVLGVHYRTITAWISKGHLRTTRQGFRVGVWEEDVVDLHNAKKLPAASGVAFHRLTIVRMDKDIKVLRQEMDQVLRVLNIRREPLKLNNIELVALYETAREYSTNGWPPHVEELWASHFLRMSAHNIRQFYELTKDPHPWIPFLKLASTMVMRPYNTELVIQLAGGRDNLQSVAAVWMEMEKIGALEFERLLTKECQPDKRLLNMLARRREKDLPL